MGKLAKLADGVPEKRRTLDDYLAAVDDEDREALIRLLRRNTSSVDVAAFFSEHEMPITESTVRQWRKRDERTS